MTPHEIVAICTAREGCAGCSFARRPSTCGECGAEIEDDEDAPACAAEVDGLEPYLWPMTPPDDFFTLATALKKIGDLVMTASNSDNPPPRPGHDQRRSSEMIQIKNRHTGAVLLEVNAETLAGADLSGAALSYADLSGADLSGANFRHAVLIYADLSGANFPGADLSGANLSGANFTAADLSGADFTGANFIIAHLSGANFIGANLSGADFTEAHIVGANFTGATIEDCRGLPKGLNTTTA